MTQTQTLPKSPARARKTTLGLVLTAVVLSVSLTGCGGSKYQNTTCGELKKKSSEDTIQFIKDAADDDGGKDAKALKQTLDSVPDEAKDATADGIKSSLCDGKSDGTKLKDTDLYEQK